MPLYFGCRLRVCPVKCPVNSQLTARGLCGKEETAQRPFYRKENFMKNLKKQQNQSANPSLKESIRQIKQECVEFKKSINNQIRKLTNEKGAQLARKTPCFKANPLETKEEPLKNRSTHPHEYKPIEKATPKNNYEKEFLKIFKQLTYSHKAWDIWRDFIIMFACAISNSVDKNHYDKREKRYLDIIKHYQRYEQQLFPELTTYMVLAMEENPEQDFLGKLFMDLNLGSRTNGQFFTPYYICEFMAKITENDVAAKVEKDGYITLLDPCCGAGATLIAGVNEARIQLEKVNLNFQDHVFVVAQDIDEIVALMCYIQISLLGVAGYVKVGNALTDPIVKDDFTENYWFTPMYFSKVWGMRRLFHTIDDLVKGEKT